MKVLYLHQYFTLPTQAGGTRSYEMARQLIDHGHQVTMVCGLEGNAKIDLSPTHNQNICRGMVDGIDVIQISVPYSNNMGLVARAKSFCSFAWHSTKFAMKEDYDVLFATSTPLTAGIPGIVMKLFRRKKKFIFEVRDLWPELPKALGMTNPFWIGCMSLLEWLSYHLADGCIGLSPGICEGIRKRSQKNKPIEMVPNGCDLDIFKPSLREPLQLEGIEPNDKVAIFTGAHGIANGLDAILDMAKIVKDRGRKDIKIAFIGKGKMKQHLQERVKTESIDNCLFYDPIPKTHLAKIVASATVGLMVLKNVPAFYYGTSPNKFFDYIASGLPIINNYPGWLAGMIKENNCGVVVEPDNAQAFADALIEMVDNELLAVFSKNARALAEKVFDREILGKRFVSFFEKVVFDRR
jgi:glycosyltransferase involved in cell wall biosynthesis